MRRPTKRDSLTRLLEAGLEVDAVIDVGIMYETADLKAILPGKKHYLIEPIEEFYPAIEKNYAGMNYELIRAAASDETGTFELATKSIFGGGVSHSNLVVDGNRPEGMSIREIKTFRLDDIKDRLPGNLLLKIDVDGAELKVLRGAIELLKKVNCVVVEASRQSFFGRVEFLHQQGFEVFDIVDICYYKGFYHQCDVVMMRREFINDPRFNGWLQGPFVSAEFKALD